MHSSKMIMCVFTMCKCDWFRQRVAVNVHSLLCQTARPLLGIVLE